MNGIIWETKSPIKYSKRSFEDNFEKAIKQSENVIFDLRFFIDVGEMDMV